MDGFDFNIGNEKIATIGVNEKGLTLNGACIKLLNSPEYITVGLDRENKRLAVKPLSEDSGNVRCYRFVNPDKKQTMIYIYCAKLKTEILKLLDMRLPKKGLKLTPYYDKKQNALIVDLEKKN